HSFVERRHEAFVDGVYGLAERRACRLIERETPALLGGIGELAESVAELDAAHVELEALAHARVVRLRPREGSVRDGVVDEKSRAEERERRLDLLDEDAKERILVVGGHREEIVLPH